MKKVVSLGIIAYMLISMVFSNNMIALASESSGVNYTEYEPGVTVEADAASPTGYYATFIFEDETTKATKVELYSDTLHHYTIEDGFANPYQPIDYKAGMFPAGGNAETTLFVDMESLGESLWGVKVPLSSGAFVYNFRITNPDGSTTARLDDPNNSTLTNTATNISSLSSMVYVPYNSVTMGTGDFLDRSVELPREDDKVGTVETVSYTGAADDKRGLAVYLPKGYDPNREEPYKVLYMSHGMSGDRTGNELRWMNEGAVANITDNLIADGTTEPFVVVTMNNQDFDWDYEKIEKDQFDFIMPFIEDNYNVHDTPDGRAYAGLSMGGMTTNRMYFNHADDFAYFGIWSYAVTGDELNNIDNHSNLDSPSVMLGTGIWDFGLEPVKNLGKALTQKGIDHSYLEVPAAHDWETWQLLYAAFLEDHLWKTDKDDSDSSGFDYTAYEPGVTVEADTTSPTGYYATFIFEDATTEATKVELYSDTFHHYTVADGFSNPYQPEEYKAGMYPAGGNADTTLYVTMENLGDDLWGARIPLSSGAFVYNYRITNPDGSTTGRLDDPYNPTLTNTATNISSLSSMVYIPYNSETMGTGDFLDRSVELPRTDNKTGTVETVAYTGAADDKRGLAVYLPNGYDPNREEPYKVLYMSHGMSGDKYGNELRWMNEGAVANISDNLIADGTAEPFVVVTMNNQDFDWDYAKIEEDQFDYIMPYIEANYNVHDTPDGRAYAGLSMGGITTNRMYFNHADDFAYFGIWSYAATGDELNNIDTYSNLDSPSVMLGTGIWDFGLEPVKNLDKALTEKGIEHAYLEVPAAHDWETWQLLYAAFVQDHLWKSDKEGSGDPDDNGDQEGDEDPGDNGDQEGNGDPVGNGDQEGNGDSHGNDDQDKDSSVDQAANGNQKIDGDQLKDKGTSYELPNTATTMFNFMLFGTVLLVLGVIFIIFQRKKRFQ